MYFKFKHILSQINIPFALFLTVAVSCLCIWVLHITIGPNVEPGEIWISSYNEDDPFTKTIYDTLQILDVKAGYVLYKTTDGDTTSVDKMYFKFKRKVE